MLQHIFYTQLQMIYNNREPIIFRIRLHKHYKILHIVCKVLL